MWPRRGLNRIAWAGGALTLVGFTPTYGEHPRNFGIHPSGRWLVVANQNTDNIVRATPLHHSQQATATRHTRPPQPSPLPTPGTRSLSHPQAGGAGDLQAGRGEWGADEARGPDHHRGQAALRQVRGASDQLNNAPCLYFAVHGHLTRRRPAKGARVPARSRGHRSRFRLHPYEQAMQIWTRDPSESAVPQPEALHPAVAAVMPRPVGRASVLRAPVRKHEHLPLLQHNRLAHTVPARSLDQACRHSSSEAGSGVVVVCVWGGGGSCGARW